MLGDFLRSKFDLHIYVAYTCIFLGLAASIREVVRIIRLVIKIDRGS
jgi:hypothetical protein